MKSALMISCEKYCEEESKEKNKHKAYYVMYNEINLIMLYSIGFLLEIRFEIIRLIFDNDSLQIIIESLQEIPKKFLGINIALQKKCNYIEKKITEVDEFSLPIVVKRNGAPPQEINIIVNDLTIVEENSSDSKILHCLSLNSLQGIKLRRKNYKRNKIKLYFWGRFKLAYWMTIQELDFFLSQIIHEMLSNEKSNNFPLIIYNAPLLSVKIFGNIETDARFEPGLFSRLLTELKEGDIHGENMENILEELAINCNCKTGDADILTGLFDILSEFTLTLCNLEANEPLYQSYLQDIKSPDKRVLALHSIISKSPLILQILRKILESKGLLLDSSTIKKYFDILFALSGSKDPIISFSSSLTICALLKVKSSDKIPATLSCLLHTFAIQKSLFDLLSRYLEKTQKDFFNNFFDAQETQNINFLHIYGLLYIFGDILANNKDRVLPDYVYSIVERHNMLEQILLIHSKPIIYQSTLILSQCLLALNYSGERGKLQSIQGVILNYTMLLLSHLYLILHSSSARQQRLSGGAIALLISGNEDCIRQLSQIVPNLAKRTKVDSISTLVNWKPEQWKEFFILAFQNQTSCTKYWDSQCKEELRITLKKSIINFLKYKYSESEPKWVKWNHEKFEVVYSTLESLCFVSPYYLSKLIEQKPCQAPYFQKAIKEPVSFFNNLVAKYLNSTEFEMHKLILIAMRLLSFPE